ncbi:hypothetical protein H6504_02455 [Candidatus Woesearchaeota archaeon]|nr:hypothetical protein [Candidatus Woesearchaeota archaeon]
MSNKFTTGKKIGSEMLEDILNDFNLRPLKLPKEIHAQRYFTMLDNFYIPEFMGFVYGLSYTSACHPVETYKFLTRDKSTSHI